MITDTHARAQAILPDQSFIVQAPAGSGKTELLTQRVLSLLASNAKTPESVLAITFTKKAAHEMRLRVVKALQAGLDPNKPSAPHQAQTWELARRVLAQDEAQGWDLLKNPQRLQIMTIDALCASLVRQLPIVSNMGGMALICEDAQSTYLEAAKTTLKELLAQHEPQVQTLLLHLDNQQQKAVELIASMLANREQWLPIIIQFDTDDDLRVLLEYHLDNVVGQLLKDIANQFDEDCFRRVKPLLQFAVNHAGQGELPLELQEVLEWTWPLPRGTENLNSWKALYQWLFTTTGTVRKSPDKRTGFPAATDAPNKEEKALYASMKNAMKEWLAELDNNKACVESCLALPLLPSPEYTDSQWSILLALLHVLPHACAQLIVQLQARNEIDFSGVAQAALVALGHHDDPSALTLKLDYQLQHILIDEFQDTSLLQYALLEKLVAAWLPEEGRTLFLVGDPMQSIYRFRQAEVGLFLRVQDHGLGQVSVKNLHLQANFRSDPSVINWINTHAPLCFSESNDMNFGAIRYSPSQAAREAQTGAGVNLHATGDIVPCLQELLQDEKLQSIAILVRARSHLKDITQALKTAKISYQAVELEHLSVQPLVQDLMALTRALVHLADSVAWLAVLRSPFCGFSLSDITVIREMDLRACLWQNICAVPLDALSDEGQRIWQRIHPFLAHCLAQRMAGALSKTVEETWLALGGPACVRDVSDLRLAENFFSILAKFEKGGTVPDMQRLAWQLEHAYVKSPPGASRIQIMTLHKAKGLEFDAVLLPELQRPPNHPDHDLLIWEKLPTEEGDALLIAPINPTQGETDPLYNFLNFTRKQKDNHELGRLLYVGMTRAKRQLHLFARLSLKDIPKAIEVAPRRNEAERAECTDTYMNTQGELQQRRSLNGEGYKGEAKAPPKGSLLSLLWPALEDDFMSLHEPEVDPEILLGDQPGSQPMRLASDWVGPAALPLASEGDNSVSMNDFSYEAHQHRQQGVLLHRMLCKIAVQGLNKWDTIKIPALIPSFVAQLHELGIFPGAHEIAIKLGQALNDVLHDPRGRWILDAHLHHEAEAVYGSSIIDRTFVDQSGIRWVIDYKTSQPGEQSLSDFYHAQHEQYRRQLATYAQIFVDRGEKNIKCALYFPLFGGWVEW